MNYLSKMKYFFRIKIIVLFVLNACGNEKDYFIDLSGSWKYAADHHNIGIEKIWCMKEFNDSTELPLPETSFTSNAIQWYQRSIIVPKDWNGKYIELFIERCEGETRLWVDGHAAGMQNSMLSPHRYDLTSLLTPGKHKICLAMDNRKNDSGDNSKGDRLGISGRLELRTLPPVHIAGMHVSHVSENMAILKLAVRNITGKKIRATLSVDLNDKEISLPGGNDVIIDAPAREFEFRIPLNSKTNVWNEEPLNTVLLHVSLTSNMYRDRCKTQVFTMREIRKCKGGISFNGDSMHVDSNQIAELTFSGNRINDKPWWIRSLSDLKREGKRIVYFPARCPPEVAFDAADMTGIFLCTGKAVPEQKNAGINTREQFTQYVKDEKQRMMMEYGHHPSFIPAFGTDLKESGK